MPSCLALFPDSRFRVLESVSRHIPERGDDAFIRGHVVRTRSIGGAESAACFAYPEFDSDPEREDISNGL